MAKAGGKRIKHIKVSLSDDEFADVLKAARIQGIKEPATYVHLALMLDLRGKSYLFDGEAVESDRVHSE